MNLSISQLNALTSRAAKQSFVELSQGGESFKATLRQIVMAGYGYFSLKDYGCVGDGVTPDDAAAQSCINACHVAGGGKVLADDGVYLLASDPARTTSRGSFRAQLYIPYSPRNADGKSFVTIEFIGESHVNYEMDGGISYPPPENGAVFKSTWVENTYSDTAVLGYEPSGDNTDIRSMYNYTFVYLDRICVMTQTLNGSTPIRNFMWGINLRYVCSMKAGMLKICTTGPLSTALNPNNGGMGSVGMYMPESNNHGILSIDFLYVTGYREALVATEHATINYFGSAFNYIGVTVKEFYTVFIGHLCTEMCVNNIVLAQGGKLTVGAYESEQGNTGWYANDYEVFVANPASDCFLKMASRAAHYQAGVRKRITANTYDFNIQVDIDEAGHTIHQASRYAVRPPAPFRNEIIFNSTAGVQEMWNGTTWVSL